MDLPEQVRDELLSALRDCAADPAIYDSFRYFPAMENSLLRGLDEDDIKKSYAAILVGSQELTEFQMRFEWTQEGNGSLRLPQPNLELHVIPHSKPPTNVHAVIGRNGVGKTQLLKRIADSFVQQQRPAAEVGVASNLTVDKGNLTSLLTVAFSYFDEFPMSTASLDDHGIYKYVGLRTMFLDNGSWSPMVKSSDDLKSEFARALDECFRPSRKHLWDGAMRTLSNDPGFDEFGFRRKTLRSSR